MRTQAILATPASKAGTNVLLADVLGYKHPELVERLKRKLGLSDNDASMLFDDVKKYLYLVATTHKKLAPTPAIDAGWHEFLMYTRGYAGFCNRFFGTFIHHTPDTVLTPKLVVHVADTIALAKSTFGSLSNNWTAPTSADCSPECSPDSDCHGDGSCGGDV